MSTPKSTSLIPPHGGTLINRVLMGEAREEAAERAAHLEAIILNDLNLADLEMIAGGSLSPLTGYMERADYESVVHHMRLANGLPWTIPVTLAVSTEQASRIRVGQAVALVGRRAQAGDPRGARQVRVQP
jgi:ATP sulfurylase